MRKYFLLFLILSGVFIAHFGFSGQAIYGDGIDYWAYLHTWYFDHNYDFNNEFRHQYQPQFNNSHPGYLTPNVQKTAITPIGRTDNIHPAGTSLLLLPFYILGDLLIRTLNILGLSFPANGYSDIYQLVCGLGAVFYVTVAIYILQKLTGVLPAMAILFASPLLYYGSYDILNSHFASFFLSVCFWFLLFKADFRKIHWLWVTGMVVGLAGLVRIQDLLLFIPLLLRLQSFEKFLISVMGGLLSFWPQFYIWWSLYGFPLPYTYMVGFQSVPLWGSLVHPINGLIRTPILIFSLVGLPRVGGKLIYLLAFLIPSATLIMFQGGWIAPAYGARMYISSLPVFAFFLKGWLSRFRPKFAASLVVLFSVLNILSIFSFVFLEKEVNSGAKRGLEEHTQTRINTLINRLLTP